MVEVLGVFPLGIYHLRSSVVKILFCCWVTTWLVVRSADGAWRPGSMSRRPEHKPFPKAQDHEVPSTAVAGARSRQHPSHRGHNQFPVAGGDNKADAEYFVRCGRQEVCDRRTHYCDRVSDSCVSCDDQCQPPRNILDIDDCRLNCALWYGSVSSSTRQTNTESWIAVFDIDSATLATPWALVTCVITVSIAVLLALILIVLVHRNCCQHSNTDGVTRREIQHTLKAPELPLSSLISAAAVASKNTTFGFNKPLVSPYLSSLPPSYDSCV